MNLQVGDVVTFKFIGKEFRGVVTRVMKSNDVYLVLRRDGDAIMLPTARLTKTGERIDIASILEKLKE